MNDEHEIEGILVGQSIEDEHGLDGEMPGTGSVGGGHDDCDAAHHKGDQGAGDAQMGSGGEAEEGEIIVQEIAAPYPQCEQQVERYVAHMAQREHSLPDAAEGGFHLIIYRQFLE